MCITKNQSRQKNALLTYRNSLHLQVLPLSILQTALWFGWSKAPDHHFQVDQRSVFWTPHYIKNCFHTSPNIPNFWGKRPWGRSVKTIWKGPETWSAIPHSLLSLTCILGDWNTSGQSWVKVQAWTGSKATRRLIVIQSLQSHSEMVWDAFGHITFEVCGNGLDVS